MKKIILITFLLLSYFLGYSQSSYPFIAGYTPTTGDLLYYNGTKWVAIPAVAFVNGQALSGNGTGVAPTYKSLFGSLSGILMANGSGVLSVGVAGTNYVSPSITIGGQLPLQNGGNLSANRTLTLAGLPNSLGTANQIPGTNAGATAWEYKTLTAGTGVSISHSAGAVTIGSTLALTTTGTSGAATLVGNTLNVPNYTAGSTGVQRLASFYTDAASTTSSADAYVYTVPANTLVANSNIINAEYSAQEAATGTYSYTISFGANIIYTSGSQIAGGSDNVIKVVIIRDSPTTCRYHVYVYRNGATYQPLLNQYGGLTFDPTVANNLKFTMSSSTAAVYTLSLGVITYLP